MKHIYLMFRIYLVLTITSMEARTNEEVVHNVSTVENSTFINITKTILYEEDNVTLMVESKFDIDSDYCSESSKCNTSSDSLRCSCDELCAVLNDCCPNVDNMTNLNMSKEQFSCSYIEGVGKLMLATKCAADWDENRTMSLCEQHPPDEDSLSRVIVSHKTIKGIVYKNMYCALCNYVNDYIFWTAVILCDGLNQTDTYMDISNCQLAMAEPKEYDSYRNCALHSSDIISDCPVDYNNTRTKEKCEQGKTLLVYFDSMYKKFKNKHCGVCNGYTEDLTCVSEISSLEVQRYWQIYSYRILVDFNAKQTVEKFDGQEFETRLPFKECSDSQLYDPLSRICRDIICPENTEPSEGRCSPYKLLSWSPIGFTNATNISTEIAQCHLSKVNPNEFEFLNDTNKIIFRGRIYNDTEYFRYGSDIFLCMNLSVSLSRWRYLQASDKIERYMSFVGLIISIVSLSITILIYLVLPGFLNTPGKNLVSLCVSLLISQLLFLISPHFHADNMACKIIAVMMHFCYLAAISWMNVIAFDHVWTFSNQTAVSNREGTLTKKFHFYSLYSWCIPLIVVFVAILFDFVVENENYFRPHYGKGECWISSKNALLLFFVGPLALSKLFDIVAFGVVAYHIRKAKRQGAMATDRANSRTFIIYIKLSFVMGLTWALAFIANFTGNTIIWYSFITFNTLQGLFISISFICTRRVFRLIKTRYNPTPPKSFNSQQSTHTTPISLRNIENS